MDLSWIVTHHMKGHVKTGHPKLTDLRGYPKTGNEWQRLLTIGIRWIKQKPGDYQEAFHKRVSLRSTKKWKETCDCGVRCGRHSAQQFDPCLRCCQESLCCHCVLYPSQDGVQEQKNPQLRAHGVPPHQHTDQQAAGSCTGTHKDRETPSPAGEHTWPQERGALVTPSCKEGVCTPKCAYVGLEMVGIRSLVIYRCFLTSCKCFALWFICRPVDIDPEGEVHRVSANYVSLINQ